MAFSNNNLDETTINYPYSYEERLKIDLEKALPNYTVSFQKKSEFAEKYRFQKTQDILDDANFLRFNSKKATNVLIFDIDTFEDFDKKPNIVEMKDYFEQQTGAKPSWTLETDKGYHIGLILDNPVFATHKDGKNVTSKHLKLLELKKVMSKVIGADATASNRSYGIWRNPLTHKHIYNPNKHNINHLFEEFDIRNKIFEKVIHTQNDYNNCPKMNLTSKNKIKEAIEKGFYVGNRNNFIFAFGYKIVFENRKIANEKLEIILQNKNKTQKNPLTQKEIKDIVSSIIKLKPTMHTRVSQKIRGKLSNLMWKLNIHGVSQRRAFAGYYTAKERTTKTLKKIIKVIIDFLEKGITPSFSQISNQIEMSEQTVKRQMTRHINIEKIRYQYHKEQAKNPHQIDIRPYEINKLVEEIKRNFAHFTPSLKVLKQDFERKKEYLKQFTLLAS